MSAEPHDDIEEVYRAKMQGVAEAIDVTFNGQVAAPNKQIGFVLLLFPYGEPQASRLNYISNGPNRADIAMMFREMAAKFDGQPQVTGHA